MYIRVPVPLSCIPVSISATIPISVPVPVLVSISVPVPVSAMVVVAVVMIVGSVVISAGGAVRDVLVVPVLPVALIVLMLIVLLHVWLAAAAVVLVVVMVVAITVVMYVIMAPVAEAHPLLVLLHRVLYLFLPLLGQVSAWDPLVIIPVRLYFRAAGRLIVQGVSVMLHPAVVVVMMVVVGVLGSLWFSSKQPLFLLLLALLSLLFLCWG